MRHRFTAGLLTLMIGAGLLAFGAPSAEAGKKSGKKRSGLSARAGNGHAYGRYRGSQRRQYQYAGRYQNGGSHYQRRSHVRQYVRSGSHPYVTDEWGNRRYYDPRQGDGFHRYDGRPYRRAGFVSRYEVETQNGRYHRGGDVYCPPGQSRAYNYRVRRR